MANIHSRFVTFLLALAYNCWLWEKPFCECLFHTFLPINCTFVHRQELNTNSALNSTQNSVIIRTDLKSIVAKSYIQS